MFSPNILTRFIAILISASLVADPALAAFRSASFHPRAESSLKTQALFQEQAFQSIAVWFAHVLASFKTMGQIRSSGSWGFELAYEGGFDAPETPESSNWKDRLHLKFARKLTDAIKKVTGVRMRDKKLAIEVEFDEDGWALLETESRYADAYRDLLQGAFMRSERFRAWLQSTLSLNLDRKWKVRLEVIYAASGHYSDVAMVVVKAASGNLKREYSFALKMSPVGSTNRTLSEADIRAEMLLAKKYAGQALFERHFYGTLFYETFAIPVDTRRAIRNDIDSENSPSKVPKHVTFHLGPWFEGETVEEHLEGIFHQGKTLQEDEKACLDVLEPVIRIILQTWKELGGLLYDTDTDDILLAQPDGRTVFVDPHAGSLARNSQQAFLALEKLILGARATHFTGNPAEPMLLSLSFDKFQELLIRSWDEENALHFISLFRDEWYKTHRHLKDAASKEKAFREFVEEDLFVRPTRQSESKKGVRRSEDPPRSFRVEGPIWWNVKARLVKELPFTLKRMMGQDLASYHAPSGSLRLLANILSQRFYKKLLEVFLDEINDFYDLQPNSPGYLSNSDDMHRLVLAHEEIHKELGTVQPLLQEYAADLLIDHSVVQAMREDWGPPHHHEASPKRDQLLWYLEESVVQTIQKREHFPGQPDPLQVLTHNRPHLQPLIVPFQKHIDRIHKALRKAIPKKSVALRSDKPPKLDKSRNSPLGIGSPMRGSARFRDMQNPLEGRSRAQIRSGNPLREIVQRQDRHMDETSEGAGQTKTLSTSRLLRQVAQEHSIHNPDRDPIIDEDAKHFIELTREVLKQVPENSNLTVLGAGGLHDVDTETLKDPRFSSVDLLDLNIDSMTQGIQARNLRDDSTAKIRLFAADASLLTDEFYDAVDGIIQTSSSQEEARQGLISLFERHVYKGRNVPIFEAHLKGFPQHESGLVLSTMVLRSLWRYLFEAIQFKFSKKYQWDLIQDRDVRLAFWKFRVEMQKAHFRLLKQLVRPDGFIIVHSDVGVIFPYAWEWEDSRLTTAGFLSLLEDALSSYSETGRWELPSSVKPLMVDESTYVIEATAPRMFGAPTYMPPFHQDMEFLPFLAKEVGLSVLRNSLSAMDFADVLPVMNTLVALPASVIRRAEDAPKLDRDRNLPMGIGSPLRGSARFRDMQNPLEGRSRAQIRSGNPLQEIARRMERHHDEIIEGAGKTLKNPNVKGELAIQLKAAILSVPSLLAEPGHVTLLLHDKKYVIRARDWEPLRRMPMEQIPRTSYELLEEKGPRRFEAVDLQKDPLAHSITHAFLIVNGLQNTYGVTALRTTVTFHPDRMVIYDPRIGRSEISYVGDYLISRKINLSVRYSDDNENAALQDWELMSVWLAIQQSPDLRQAYESFVVQNPSDRFHSDRFIHELPKILKTNAPGADGKGRGLDKEEHIYFGLGSRQNPRSRMKYGHSFRSEARSGSPFTYTGPRERRHSNETEEGAGKTPAIPMPLRGAGQDPAEIYGVGAYEKQRADWETLRDYLVIRSPLPDHVDALLVFGSDLEQVPEGAAQLVKQTRIDHVVVSGGKGRLTPPAWTEGEAVEFAKIMKQNGIESKKEPRSTTTWQNAQFSRKLLEDEGIQVRRVVVAQSPLLQRRAFGDLKTAFKDRTDMELYAWAPYIPDYYKAPEGWSLQEWRRRQLYDAVGEIPRLLENQRLGFIPKDPVPQPIVLAALRIGRVLSTDPSIPEADRLVISNHLETMQSYRRAPLKAQWTSDPVKEAKETIQGLVQAERVVIAAERQKSWMEGTTFWPKTTSGDDQKWFKSEVLRLAEQQAEKSGRAKPTTYEEARGAASDWDLRMTYHPLATVKCSFNDDVEWAYHVIHLPSKTRIVLGRDEVIDFGILSPAQGERSRNRHIAKNKARNDHYMYLSRVMSLLRQPKLVSALLAQPEFSRTENADRRAQLLGLAEIAVTARQPAHMKVFGRTIHHPNGTTRISPKILERVISISRREVKRGLVLQNRTKIPTRLEVLAWRIAMAQRWVKQGIFVAWDSLAGMYSRYVEQMATFFVRMALLGRFAGLLANPYRGVGKPASHIRRMLSFASGPAVLARAFHRQRRTFEETLAPHGLDIAQMSFTQIDGSARILQVGEEVMRKRLVKGVPIPITSIQARVGQEEPIGVIPDGSIDFIENNKLFSLSTRELFNFFREANRMIDVSGGGGYLFLTAHRAIPGSLRAVLPKFGFQVITESNAKLRLGRLSLYLLAKGRSAVIERMRHRLSSAAYLGAVKTRTLTESELAALREDPDVIAAFNAVQALVTSEKIPQERTESPAPSEEVSLGKLRFSKMDESDYLSTGIYKIQMAAPDSEYGLFDEYLSCLMWASHGFLTKREAAKVDALVNMWADPNEIALSRADVDWVMSRVLTPARDVSEEPKSKKTKKDRTALDAIAPFPDDSGAARESDGQSLYDLFLAAELVRLENKERTRADEFREKYGGMPTPLPPAATDEADVTPEAAAGEISPVKGEVRDQPIILPNVFEEVDILDGELVGVAIALILEKNTNAAAVEKVTPALITAIVDAYTDPKGVSTGLWKIGKLLKTNEIEGLEGRDIPHLLDAAGLIELPKSAEVEAPPADEPAKKPTGTKPVISPTVITRPMPTTLAPVKLTPLTDEQGEALKGFIRSSLEKTDFDLEAWETLAGTLPKENDRLPEQLVQTSRWASEQTKLETPLKMRQEALYEWLEKLNYDYLVPRGQLLFIPSLQSPGESLEIRFLKIRIAPEGEFTLQLPPYQSNFTDLKDDVRPFGLFNATRPADKPVDEVVHTTHEAMGTVMWGDPKIFEELYEREIKQFRNAANYEQVNRWIVRNDAIQADRTAIMVAAMRWKNAALAALYAQSKRLALGGYILQHQTPDVVKMYQTERGVRMQSEIFVDAYLDRNGLLIRALDKLPSNVTPSADELFQAYLALDLIGGPYPTRAMTDLVINGVASTKGQLDLDAATLVPLFLIASYLNPSHDWDLASMLIRKRPPVDMMQAINLKLIGASDAVLRKMTGQILDESFRARVIRKPNNVISMVASKEPPRDIVLNRTARETAIAIERAIKQGYTQISDFDGVFEMLELQKITTEWLRQVVAELTNPELSNSAAQKRKLSRLPRLFNDHYFGPRGLLLLPGQTGLIWQSLVSREGAYKIDGLFQGEVPMYTSESNDELTKTKEDQFLTRFALGFMSSPLLSMSYSVSLLKLARQTTKNAMHRAKHQPEDGIAQSQTAAYKLYWRWVEAGYGRADITPEKYGDAYFKNRYLSFLVRAIASEGPADDDLKQKVPTSFYLKHLRERSPISRYVATAKNSEEAQDQVGYFFERLHAMTESENALTGLANTCMTLHNFQAAKVKQLLKPSQVMMLYFMLKARTKHLNPALRDITFEQLLVTDLTEPVWTDISKELLYVNADEAKKMAEDVLRDHFDVRFRISPKNRTIKVESVREKLRELDKLSNHDARETAQVASEVREFFGMAHKPDTSAGTLLQRFLDQNQKTQAEILRSLAWCSDVPKVVDFFKHAFAGNTNQAQQFRSLLYSHLERDPHESVFWALEQFFEGIYLDEDIVIPNDLLANVGNILSSGMTDFFRLMTIVANERALASKKVLNGKLSEYVARKELLEKQEKEYDAKINPKTSGENVDVAFNKMLIGLEHAKIVILSAVGSERDSHAGEIRALPAANNDLPYLNSHFHRHDDDTSAAPVLHRMLDRYRLHLLESHAELMRIAGDSTKEQNALSDIAVIKKHLEEFNRHEREKRGIIEVSPSAAESPRSFFELMTTSPDDPMQMGKLFSAFSSFSSEDQLSVLRGLAWSADLPTPRAFVRGIVLAENSETLKLRERLFVLLERDTSRTVFWALEQFFEGITADELHLLLTTITKKMVPSNKPGERDFVTLLTFAMNEFDRQEMRSKISQKTLGGHQAMAAFHQRSQDFYKKSLDPHNSYRQLYLGVEDYLLALELEKVKLLNAAPEQRHQLAAKIHSDTSLDPMLESLREHFKRHDDDPALFPVMHQMLCQYLLRLTDSHQELLEIGGLMEEAREGRLGSEKMRLSLAELRKQERKKLGISVTTTPAAARMMPEDLRVDLETFFQNTVTEGHFHADRIFELTKKLEELYGKVPTRILEMGEKLDPNSPPALAEFLRLFNLHYLAEHRYLLMTSEGKPGAWHIVETAKVPVRYHVKGLLNTEFGEYDIPALPALSDAGIEIGQVYGFGIEPVTYKKEVFRQIKVARKYAPRKGIRPWRNLLFGYKIPDVVPPSFFEKHRKDTSQFSAVSFVCLMLGHGHGGSGARFVQKYLRREGTPLVELYWKNPTAEAAAYQAKLFECLQHIANAEDPKTALAFMLNMILENQPSGNTYTAGTALVAVAQVLASEISGKRLVPWEQLFTPSVDVTTATDVLINADDETIRSAARNITRATFTIGLRFDKESNTMYVESTDGASPEVNRSETLYRLPYVLKPIAHIVGLSLLEEISHLVGHFGFAEGGRRLWQNPMAVFRGEIDVVESQHKVRGTSLGIGASLAAAGFLMSMGEGWAWWWGAITLGRVLADFAWIPWSPRHELKLLAAA